MTERAVVPSGMSARSPEPPGTGRKPPPRGGAAFIPFVFPGIEGVRCAFSTGLAGNLSLETGFDREEVTGNRKDILDSLGLSRWVELKQVHGDGMVPDAPPTPLDEKSELEGDGSSTCEPGLALAVKTADCQPILLADSRGRAVAALHVGWRGNARNFPGGGVERFCRTYGLLPAEVLAVRGPSLGPGAAQFINFDREWPPQFAPWFDAARKTMDLWNLTRSQLLGAGLLPGNIFSLDLCTHSLPDLFFSHRRGHTGRQVSFIWIREGGCP